jgi:hypothetical protein
MQSGKLKGAGSVAAFTDESYHHESDFDFVSVVAL